MQVRLLSIEMSISELRVASAAQGAKYGALSGAVAAALSIIVSATIRSWLEGRKSKVNGA